MWREGGQGGQPSLAKQVVMGGMEVMSSVEQGGRVMSSAEQGAEQSPKWGRVGGRSGEGDIWVRWAKMQFSNFPLSSIRCMVQLFLVSSRICWVYCPSASRVERAENRQADSAGSMVARSFCDNHRSKGTKNRTQTQVLRTTGFI